ncbi:ABC1 kinase family protein [Desulfopila inferna]|uniref:ABC1 kinase family protein n=1 Tax=Desulfopila inferna TaxID=468528 RepID=UPI00196578DC|nr:AarF/UbiB family protein [Desulfopila inferna]MBM9604439.1 AarF/ABC1/UbiB kinase family protein [Desulfopila inferna]
MKGLRRFGAITGVLVRHGYGNVIERMFKRSRKKDAETTPEISPAFHSPARIRRMLEELGPSFIKLGQLMSVRADVFPVEYTEEFKKLQDSIPPVPFSSIRDVIEAELEVRLSDIFSKFSPEAMAAASVAQVHEARLKNGDRVAVKVIRPGIEIKIRDDIHVMRFFAERLEKMFEFARVIGLINLVKEFERTIFRELDMYIEGGNIEKFAANFKGSKEIYTARVYWDYSSKSVLVMEYIDGMKMDEVEKIRQAGIDPKEVAMIGLRSFSRQLMDFGFFHADPHPGNTIVMYDGRVSLVDFGIIGYLDEETMTQVANIFLGYAEHDYDMIMDAFRDAGIIDEEVIDLKRFRADLKDMSEPFYGRSLQTIAVKDVYEQVMRVAYKYHIRLPRNLLLLLKTFVQTEGLGKILGSDASILEVTRPYAKKLVQRGYDTQSLLKNMGRDTRTMGTYLKMMPRLTHAIFKRTAEGRHRLEIRHRGLESIANKFERGLNRAVTAIIIAASTIAGSLVLNSPDPIMNISLGDFSVSLTTLLGILGYSIATFLGLWLIISIFKSGKM